MLAYCQAASGFHADAVSNMQLAVDRDPGHWRYRYGLAVVRAAAGLDPRPAIAAARDRNPLSRAVARASRAFDTPRPGVWRRQAAVLLRRAE